MLTTIYQFAGHHIPENMYLHGIFTTVLGQLPTIMYIPFASIHTLTYNMKSLETKIPNTTSATFMHARNIYGVPPSVHLLL